MIQLATQTESVPTFVDSVLDQAQCRYANEAISEMIHERTHARPSPSLRLTLHDIQLPQHNIQFLIGS